jgi:hypothetical protein
VQNTNAAHDGFYRLDAPVMNVKCRTGHAHGGSSARRSICCRM